jgi:hypothetical protein
VQEEIDINKKEADDANVIWAETPKEQEPTFFDIVYIAINKDDETDTLSFKAQDDDSAKHWIINNLDMSRAWKYTRA